ncbi:unnamed protein product [Anisakis simplex]|uniref:Uncharacterized protein n=1 Tax=Anisakis simplex TaxID=6269 RepID=A0A3P6SYV3_ANISI|nr:unnamed protein product [Anisakis simplex]
MNVSLAEYKELFPRGSGKMPEKKIGRRLSKKGLRQRLQADFRMLDAAITTDLPMRNCAILSSSWYVNPCVLIENCSLDNSLAKFAYSFACRLGPLLGKIGQIEELRFGNWLRELVIN